MKFEFNWPSGLRENDDRRTDSEIIGILIAHLGAFGLGRASDFFQGDPWSKKFESFFEMIGPSISN